MSSANFNDTNWEFTSELSGLGFEPLKPESETTTSSSLLSSEIIFVDETVKDYQSLIAGFEGSVFTLDSSLDSIGRVSEVLAQQEDISGVHFVTHGDEGSLQLGATELNWSNLDKYSDRLTGWGNNLQENADFLFYGCNVAEGETGQDFVDRLGELTGADVAASEDFTGNSVLGGDWDLEYAKGDIETNSLALSNYQDVLASTTSLENGLLTYTATDAVNLAVSDDGTNLTIQEAGSEVYSTLLTNITSGIQINTGNGDDTIAISNLDFSTNAIALSVAGEGGDDTVDLTGNIQTFGGNFSVNAETINVGSGANVSTRQVDGSDSSIGSSGDITFTGQNITLASNAAVLAQVEDGSSYTAGTVNFTASDTGSSDDAGAGIYLEDSAVLKGGAVALNVDSDSSNTYDGFSEDDSVLDNIEEIFNGYLNTGFGILETESLVFGYARADAESTIDIGTNSQIEASRLTLDTDAAASAEVDAFSLQLGLAAAYGESNPTAKVNIGTGARINTSSDLIVSSHADSTLGVAAAAQSFGKLKGNSKYFFGATVTQADINSTVDVDSGSILNIGGNLDIDATTNKDHSTSLDVLGLTSKGGYGLGLNVALGDINAQALLDGNTETTGNIDLNAETITTTNEAASKVVIGEPDSIVSKFILKGQEKALSKIPGFKNKSSNSGQTALTGSILYTNQSNTAEARIGNGATVKSGGTLDVSAKVEEIPEFASASKAKIKSGEEEGSTTGATIATSIADIKNTAKAYIGDNTSVDASGAMSVESEIDMPFDPDVTEYFKLNFDGSIGQGIEEVNDLISNITGHIKKDLGVGVLFNSWAKAKASGDTSYAGSVNYFDVDNNSQAYIGENALINQDNNYRSGNQTVLVNAYGNAFTLHFAGNFNPVDDLMSILGNSFWILKGKSNYSTLFGKGVTSDSGIGAGVVYANTDNTIKATIKDGATIYTDALDVDAELDNTEISIGATGSITGSAKKATNISLSAVDRVGEVTAHVSDLATVESSGTITVNALDNSNTYNFTGGFATGENQGIGVAATFDIIDRTTDAILGNTSDTITFAATSDVNIDDDSIAIANHGLTTGDAIVYNNAGETSIGNLVPEQAYYVIVVDENTIKLATSQSNALAGVAQDLSSSGTGFNQELIVLDSLAFAPSGGDSDSETTFSPTEGVEGYEFIEPANETIVVDEIDVSEISNNTITLASHGLSDGDLVTYNNLANDFPNVESEEELTVENIGVLEHETTYKVIYVDDNNFQLADVNDNTNTPLDLTHSGTAEGLNQHYFTRSVLDLENNIIIYNSHGFETGDAVVYSNDGDTNIGANNTDGELVDGQTYYIIKVDDHRLQLAANATDAANEVAIDLTSTGDGKLHSLRTPVVNIDTNELNLLGHGFETGERIVYSNNEGTSIGTSSGTLVDGDAYYVIAIDSDTIKLASSYADAIAYSDTNNTAIALTDTGSGSDHSFSLAIVNLEANTITLSDHELSTGDALIYGNGGNTGISTVDGELTDGGTYYAIVIDENTIKLASSEAEANSYSEINNNALDLTNTGNGSEHQFFEKITVSLTQGTVNAVGAVTVSSENSGVVLGGAIAGTFASGSTEYASDPFAGSSQLKDYSSITGTSGGLSVSGSAVINYIEDKTRAYVKGIDLYVPDNAVNITALSDNEIYAIGGAVAIAAAKGSSNTESSYGIAGSFGFNLVTSETKAYVDNSAINSGSLNITGTNENYHLGIAASGSGSFADKGVAFAGTLTDNDVTNDTYAYIANYSNVNSSGDIIVTATDSSSILSVAGALQYSGQYGIGASIGLNFTDNTTLAYIEDADISATNLSLNATNTNTIHAFAVAAGASLNGMAAEFSLTYNNTANTTEAYIDNGYTEIETNLNGKLSLLANDDAEIFSLAGVFGFSLLQGKTDSYAATIGISIAINEIENQTKARIKDGRVVAQGDLELIADSTSTITAYSISGSGSASWNKSGLVMSGAGAGTRNIVNNTIDASIDDLDDSNNIDTNVDAAGAMTVKATDNSTIYADAGGAAVSLAIAGDSWSTSAALSVGAGVASNEITNTVTAHVTDASVEADGTIDISAISNSTIDAFALGAAVSGTYSSSGIGVSLTGAGAGTENIIENQISAYVADTSQFRTTTSSGAISLLAQDNSKVTADAGGYALSLKFGNGMANGSASVGVSVADNDIANTVEAYISNAVVNSAAGVSATATSTGTVDLFSIGAAASGSVGSSGLNVSLSGAGTGVENKIANTVRAFVDNNSTVTSANSGAITIKATDNSTVTADAGGFAVAVSIGSGFSGGVTAGVATAENIISNAVSAYIDNAEVTAAGDLTIEATSTSNIENLTMAGAVSVAASTSASLSASGAGAATTNDITNTIEAYIQDGSKATSTSGAISLNAQDNSTIESVAVGGSISVSGSTSASFSMAIAGVEVNNTIGNTVRSYIGATSSDSTTVDAAGDLKLTANSTLTFNDNYAVAASLAAAVAPSGASLSGAGANVITTTTNTVETLIRNLTTADAVRADNVTLTATDTPTIKPTVGTGSLAASFIGASVSVSLTDTTINNAVNAYIDNSKVTTTNDVTLNASSTPTIESEAVTTSVAAAIGGAGAGGEVTATISSTVSSYVSNNAVVSANDVTVGATSTPTIDADVVGVAVSSITAIGASVTDIEFNGTTKAYIDKADVVTTGNLDVTATTTPILDGNVTALSAGIATAGAGNSVTAKDTSTTEAYVTNAADLDVTNTLTITAIAQPKVTGDAFGVSAAGGIQVGYSEVTVEVAPVINAYIGSNADVTASDLSLTAQQILPDTGISAEANASASGGSLIGSVNATTAEARNTASTTIDINSGAILNITNTATLQTDLNSSQDAFADGYNGGILALGFNNALAESDTSNNIDLASNSTINADTFSVYVNGDDDNYAESIAGGGGIISGRAAEAETRNTNDTQANIDSQVTVNTIDVAAEHIATFNAKTDSTNASLVGASGANSENTVNANVEVNFNSNANVTAYDDFDVAIINNIEQAALDDENAESGSGGVVDLPAVETVTTITNTSNINVNDGAILSVGDEDYDTIDNMDFAILNDVRADVKSKLNSGGLISSAKADAEVTNNTNQAYINIGDADITSTHDLNFSTRAIADLEAEANASAYGLSGVSKGDTLAEANVDNQIILNSGASVTAEGDVNFAAGEDTNGNSNSIQVNADTNLWNKSASPMSKNYIDADGNITLNNAIAINNGAAVSSGQDLNLISNNNDGSYSAEASGEGTDVYSQVASSIANFFGADVSSVLTNDSTSETFINGVTVDGNITAGVDNVKSLTINEDYSVATNDETVTVTESTVNLAEEIQAIIDDLNIQITEAENSTSADLDLDAIQAEIDFWEQELSNLGDISNTKVLEVSDIEVAVGSINVSGDYLVGSGSLEAKGDAEIAITNLSDAYFRINDVKINDNYGGQLLFNNAAITANSDLSINSDLVDFTNITTTDSEETEAKITIENQYENFSGSGSILEIKGEITNRNGSVNITNAHGTIYVTTGEISAKTINIDSGESFYLSDGYAFTVGSSPEAIWNDEFQSYVATVEEAYIYDHEFDSGTKKFFYDGTPVYQGLSSDYVPQYTDGSLNYRLDYEVTDSSLIQDKFDEASGGSLVAESSVFIDAKYINVAGTIESGIADYNLTLDSNVDSIIQDFKTEQTTFSKLADNLNAIADFDSLDALNSIDLPENSYIYGNSIYLLSKKEDYWHHVKEYGESLGGSLVTINNKYEQDWLYDTFGGSERLWIGLTDNESYGGFESARRTNPATDGWVWANGEELTYTNWNSGEPNDSDNNEDYAQMEPSGFWNDNDNYLNYGSQDLVRGIIEIPLSHFGVSHDVYVYNDRFYILSDAGTWQETQTQAAALGGNLVSINDESEQDWIESTFSHSEEFWIGYHDRNQEGVFEWIDGSAVGYTNWDENEPNDFGTGEDYTVLTTNGLWNDSNSNSGNTRRGIIELSSTSDISIASLLDLSDYFPDTYGNNITARYNSESDRIEVEDVSVRGGYVQLVGNIVSTGNGSIKAMDGFGNITIDNQTDYELELSQLDTGGEGVEGQIKIIDLGQTGYNDDGTTTNLTTTYTQDVNGDIVISDNSQINGYTQTSANNTVDYVLSDRNLYYQWDYRAIDDVTLSSPNTTSTTYNRYDGKLYFLTEDKGSWTATQTDALSYDGNLVTINDADEQAWIESKFSSYGENFWIGYTDKDSEGNFEWVSGETADYTNWNSGEPNNDGDEDYVNIYPDGTWNDRENNDGSYNGIVEYDAATLTRVYDGSEQDGLGRSITTNWDTDNPTFSSEVASYIWFAEENKREVVRDYQGTVRANYDIEVGFIGNDTGSIQVNSDATVWLNEDITNISGNTTIDSSAGSVRSLTENEINTESLTINSNGSIGDSDIAINTDLEGGTLNATATGDIYIDETQGDLTVDTVSTSGNVNLEAYGNLAANSIDSKITGQEISLTSDTGNIGSSSLDVNIDSGSSETGSVTIDAASDINVTETSGDLYLASANSSNGDVDLSVTSGNIIDYNPEETEDLAARADLLDTVWSDMELTDEDISSTATDETGAASAAASEAVEAYERAQESEYELYWQYRNLTPVYDDDNNITDYTYDEYNPDYVYSFSDTEETQLIELGYSDSAIATLEENKTTEYHTLHEELATSGLTDDYDPDYTYTATTEEEAEITAGAVWTVDELTRVINPGLLLPVSDTEVDIEAENIQASNLTLNVGGGIGIDEGTKTIDVRNADGSIIGISDEDLLYLLTAEPNDITYLDISGIEVSDPNDNAESIYSIVIEQIDDLDFEAKGELNVTATADAYLGSEADITINDLDVGANEIRLKSGKGISGTTTSSTHITASNTIIEAGDASIGSDTTPIELATNSLTARANNDIYLNQASGDLDIEQIYAGDNVNLTVAGEIRDRNDTDDENIRSTDISNDSGDNNSIGSSDNYLDVYLEADGSYRLDTTQDAYLSNTSGTGILNLDFVGTAGTLTYSNGIYTITDSTSGTAVNFTGFEAIDITFANQNNSFVVEALAGEITLNLYGDAGNDNIELSNAIEGIVNIDGGEGANTLVLNDANDSSDNAFTVTDTEITGHLTQVITHSNIDTIDIQGGTGSNDSLTVTNESDAAQTITADNTSIASTDFINITHSGIETIDYYAETGDNTIDTAAFTAGAIALTIYSNLGDNENTIDLTAPTSQAKIIVEVAENTTNLKVAKILSTSSNFSLSGTDAASFEMIGDELHFITAPDFEVLAQYEVTVTDTDTNETVDLTIPVTDINEAPSLSLENSTLTLAEDTDTTSSIKIGDIVISDDALGDNVLSLSGDDAESFELVNDTELYLVAGTSLDYETDSALDVIVNADDGTFSVPFDATVNLTDVNEAPSISFDYTDTYTNRVLALDGDGDYVKTNSDVINFANTDFTLEAWIQTTETEGGIIGKADDDTTWESGEKAFYINSSGQAEFIGNGNNSIVGNTAVNDGQWHHVAVVWDAANSQGYIYVDGVNDTKSENYSTNTADNQDDTFKLGLAYGASYFSGELDNVRIWNKALTQDEIQTSLSTTATGDEENLVAYYNFDDDNFYYYNTLVDNASLESDRGVITLAEDTDTTERVKIADIPIDDDALGTNNLTLSGDDADLFEIDGTELYIAAGANLDYETNNILNVTVEVDDDTVGNTPDDAIALKIRLTDANDAPKDPSVDVINSELPETVNTSARIEIGEISFTDEDTLETNNLNSLSLAGDDADLFEIENSVLYIQADATVDYETNPTLDVTVEVDDDTVGDTPDDSVDVSIPVRNVNEIFSLGFTSPANQTLSLDGNGDYVSFNNYDYHTDYSSYYDPSNNDRNFTLEAWIKTSATEQQGIISDQDSNRYESRGESLFYINDSGQLTFYQYDDIYWETDDDYVVTGNTAVNDGEWHHVAYVHDDTTNEGTIFVDGVNDTASRSGIFYWGFGYVDSKVKLGIADIGNFSGEMDEVRIWSQALTQTDIIDNFTTDTKLAGTEADLFAYYTFQNDSTTTIFDEVGSVDPYGASLDGTLNGDAGVISDNSLSLDNNIEIAENSADTSSAKIADITMLNTAYGTEDLILTGDNADKLEISDTELVVKAGEILDYETDSELNFTVELDSATIEASQDITVTLTDVNETPTIALENTVTDIDENTDTTERIKVADINLSDDALGTNVLNLSGDEAEYFEIEDSVLYLKAGTTLDYENLAAYNVTVEVDDEEVGDSFETSIDFTLNVNDLNDLPTVAIEQDTAFRNSLGFDGTDDYVDTNSALFDFGSNNFTFEAWIQTTGTNQGIFAKTDNDLTTESSEKGLVIDSSGNLDFRPYGRILNGSTKVNDGAWHHIALVGENDDVYMYVDGILDTASIDFGLDADNESHTVKIGYPFVWYTSGGTNHFSGLIDEVRIWDVARTESEIAANLDTTLAGNETGLAAYYTFDTDSENTVFDATGNYDATKVNHADNKDIIYIDEDTDTSNDVKLGEVTIGDEDVGANTNNIALTGDDKDLFYLANTDDDKIYDLYLKAGTTLDYETKPQFNVTIEVNDESIGSTLEAYLDTTILVTNVNEAPTLALENTVTNLDENTDTSSRVKIADLNITDDSLASNSLSLTGDDASYFEIDGTELYLKADTAIDYETKDGYNITIELYDTSLGNTLVDSVPFSLEINNLNDAATFTVDVTNDFTSSSYLALNETYTDKDYVEIDSDSIRLDADYTFEAWINSNDISSGIFAKDNSDGVLKAGEKALHNWATNYNLRYAVATTRSNAGNTAVLDGEWHHIALVWDKDTTTVSMYVDGELNLQQTNSAFDVADNDGDTFKLGRDYSSFFMTGEMKDVRFWDVTRTQTEIQTDLNNTLTGTETGLVAYYDFAAVNTNTVSDRTGNGNDGVLVNNAQQALEIEVSDRTDTSNRVKVAEIDLTDEDTIDSYLNNVISLTGDNADKFEIDGTELYLKAGTTLDHVNEPELNLTLEVNDDTNSGSLDLKIVVFDGNQPPEIALNNTVTSLSEDTDTSSAIKVANLTVTDDDSTTDTITLTGNDADKFEVVNDSELYLKAGAELDYESDTQLDVTVEVNDGVYSDAEALSIAITDVDFALALTLENAVTSLAEDTNTNSRVKVADLTVTDDDSTTDAITLTGDDADKFEVIDNQLYLKAGTNLDYESDTQLDVSVEVSNGIYSDTETLSIAITDINEAPTITLGSTTVKLDENTDTSSAIELTDITISDPDSVTYTVALTGGDADKFELIDNKLYLKAGTDLNYELDDIHIVTVEVSDGTNTTTKNFYLELNNLVEGSVTFALENTVRKIPVDTDTTNRIKLADLVVTGGDGNETFSVASFTASYTKDFEIDGNELYLKAGVDLEKYTVGGEGGYVGLRVNVNGTDTVRTLDLFITYPDLDIFDDGSKTSNGGGFDFGFGNKNEIINGDGFDFGSVNVADGSVQYDFELYNSNYGDLEIDYIVINGETGGAGDFQIIGDIPTSIAGYDYYSDTVNYDYLTIEFDPNSGGEIDATLEVGSNDPDENPYIVYLSGTGNGTEINVAQGQTDLVSGTTQNFGSVNIDAGTIKQTFTIQNVGTETLNLGDVTLTSTNASDFTLENGSAIANTTLAAGASTDLTVTFNPSTAGEATATLTINSDDNDEAAYTIDLTGTGITTTKVEGSDNNDIINNEEGNQTIDAGAGDDTVTGSTKSENVRGGDGADNVDSGAGSDRVYGDAGNDVITGGDGKDLLRGGADNDTIYGGAGDDYLIGDAGNDYLDGEEGSDRLRGTSGSDTFIIRDNGVTDTILDFNPDEDTLELVDLNASELTFEDSTYYGLIKRNGTTIAQIRNFFASDLSSYFSD
ncbi:LamG-like jellyroll fold domain-containing protein [Myxosarcina sp. GI1]|uniref:LamG-like jellyroll fold domain-containing protein n=1 Tax=Myxosarcina sp. GI1 TaxID=1541065 RepID=UPI00055E2AEE|nr:LamG-like jellyroll fold domain-containing protein [Myxosarcina sp. GI1]